MCSQCTKISVTCNKMSVYTATRNCHEILLLVLNNFEFVDNILKWLERIAVVFLVI